MSRVMDLEFLSRILNDSLFKGKSLYYHCCMRMCACVAEFQFEKMSSSRLVWLYVLSQREGFVYQPNLGVWEFIS